MRLHVRNYLRLRHIGRKVNVNIFVSGHSRKSCILICDELLYVTHKHSISINYHRCHQVMCKYFALSGLTFKTNYQFRRVAKVKRHNIYIKCNKSITSTSLM